MLPGGKGGGPGGGPPPPPCGPGAPAFGGMGIEGGIAGGIDPGGGTGGKPGGGIPAQKKGRIYKLSFHFWLLQKVRLSVKYSRHRYSLFLIELVSHKRGSFVSCHVRF